MNNRIALVYDWIDKWGGVERLLLQLYEAFPGVDVYTAHYNKKTASWAKKWRIRHSFMQHLPSVIQRNRILSSVLYPYAFESFDFSKYDIVISVTSSFAKGVITKPGTRHISIILTPTRFLWVLPHEYAGSHWFSWLIRLFQQLLRPWDYIAAQRPDALVAISKLVADRVQTHYHRPARILHPPFPGEHWRTVRKEMNQYTARIEKRFPAGSFYLLVARLEPYKKVEQAIAAFRDRPSDTLIIVGSGSQQDTLFRSVPGNVRWFSRVSDTELAWLYTHAQACLAPQEEDYGYVALEALFFGCPVISYKQSGIAEMVSDGKNGILYAPQTVAALGAALERFSRVAYNVRDYAKHHASLIEEKYSFETYLDELRSILETT
jgi:glycosyltransferase involved in cell wall biosynthesis